MLNLYSFLVFLPKDGDLSPKLLGNYIYDIKFYINFNDFLLYIGKLVRMHGPYNTK